MHLVQAAKSRCGRASIRATKRLWRPQQLQDAAAALKARPPPHLRCVVHLPRHDRVVLREGRAVGVVGWCCVLYCPMMPDKGGWFLEPCA